MLSELKPSKFDYFIQIKTRMIFNTKSFRFIAFHFYIFSGPTCSYFDLFCVIMTNKSVYEWYYVY